MRPTNENTHDNNRIIDNKQQGKRIITINGNITRRNIKQRQQEKETKTTLTNNYQFKRKLKKQ
jgi:hypothetical protein